MEERKPKARRSDTNDRRAERKRELDRLAQRATRERTKNRIAFLEQRLAILESCDQLGQISKLTNTIDDLRNDNTRLQSALTKMRTCINEALGQAGQTPAPVQQCGCPSNSVCTCDVASPVANRNPSVSSCDSDVIDITTSNDIAGTTGLEDFFDVNSIPLVSMFEMFNPEYQWQSPVPSPFDYQMPVSDDSTAIAPDVDKWHVSNGAFITCMDSVKKRIATNSVLDLHVPFKAAIWGWDSLGAEAEHPVWLALRQVDQKVFGTWTSKAQRIALMYVCQTLLQYRENPTKANLDRVPAWFRPRPAQERIQHPAVIDFLIWPGLRDRLVFEHQKYTQTGDFSAAFVNYFNFYWPYSEKEIFAYNPMMNRYEVSKIFLEYAYNLKNWTMKPEFFKQFPELQHDIAAFEETLDFNKATWTG